MREGRYRNIAFLAELLINILVFSISCAILAGIFGQAGRLSRQTRSQSQASAEIYALFASLRAGGPAALAGAAEENGAYLLYYDKDWNPAEANTAVYTLRLQMREEETGAGLLRQLEATAFSADDPDICTLSTKTYQNGGEVAGA